MTDETKLLRNALNHIARVAAKSRTSTRRLRWIEQRAALALAGQAYDNSAFDLPKDADNDYQRLKRENAKLRVREAVAEVGGCENGFPSVVWLTAPPPAGTKLVAAEPRQVVRSWFTDDMLPLADQLGVEHSARPPLQGRRVSGLHVHQNLQILTASENSRKGNRFEVEG